MAPVKRFVRRMLDGAQRRVFSLLFARLDDIDARLDHVTAQLDDMARRVADAQAAVEAAAARAAASTEFSLADTESEARRARRFDQIERMLGAAPPGSL